MLHHHRQGFSAIVIGMSTLSWAPQSAAQETRLPFSIPGGPAAGAIAEFARQAKVNVLASSANLAGIQTNQVRGNFPIVEALDKLLANTGLTANVAVSGAIFIVPRAAHQAAPAAVPHDGIEPLAQQTPGLAPAAALPEQVVVISGARQSVMSAIELKKSAGTVVDTIAAEDIGRFPDKNVAEALARTTGVQISSEFGEGSTVSIRGVQPDLNRIELNGMTVLSSLDSGTRAPDLRELPSELIKSLEVIKGVTADTTEGGIGGTVKIRTNKPLDFKTFTLATTVSSERNSLRGGQQPRANLLIAQRFLDGKLGLMGNLVYDRVLTQADRLRNTGWRLLRDWDLSPEKTAPSRNLAAATVVTAQGCTALGGADRTDCERQWFDYSPGSPRYGLLSRDHARKTGELTAQYQLSSALSVYGSFLRFGQDSQIVDRIFQTDFASADRVASAGVLPTYSAGGVPSGGTCETLPATATPAGVVVTDHHVTEYVVGSCVALAGRGGNNAFGIQSRDFQQRIDNNYRTAGFNWRHGAWDAEGMLVRSDAFYRNDSNFIGLTMNAPGLKVTLDSRGFPHFGFPASATPDNPGAYTQALLAYLPVELDSYEDQGKLDLRYRPQLAGVSKIAFGVQSRRYGSLRYGDGGYIIDGGSNLASSADDLDVQSSNLRYTWNYDPLNPTGALRPPTLQPFIDSNNQELWVPAAQMRQLAEAITGPSPNFLAGAGMNGFPVNWMTPSYDAASAFFDTSKFTHALVREAPGRDGNIYPQISTYKVQERIQAAYLRVDFDTEAFGFAVDGNVGLRYAGTRTLAIGRQRLLQRVERTPGGAQYDDRQLSNAIVVRESRYRDYLPSVNAAAWLQPERLVLRAGYGKVMARPSLDRLNPNFICTVGSGNPQFGGDGVDNCSGGNPNLKPYRAANKDLSLEWYPRRDTQVSLAYFRKDIDTSIQNNVVVRTDLLGDGRMFDVTTAVNARGATTKGIELTTRSALSFLPGLFSGLGVDASFTRMAYDYAPGTELLSPLDGSQLPFPGMSRRAYDLGLWYDLGRVNARLAYNHRSAYYTGSNDTNTGNPLFAEPTGFLDAKVQLRLGRHWSLALEAKNLTDERTLTTAGALNRPNEYSWSGRRYFVSLGYMH